MINLEIVITLVAIIAALFTALMLLKKSNVRKKYLQQDVETLKMVKELKCDSRDPKNLVRLGLIPFFVKAEDSNVIDKDCQRILSFGIVVGLVFFSWSIYLVAHSLFGAAALSFAAAFIAMIALAHSENRVHNRKADMVRIRSEIADYEKQFYESAVMRANAVMQPPVDPVVSVDIVNNLNEYYRIAADYAVVPTDSTLKRHFISAIVAQLRQDFPVIPTDSTLKRHFQTTIAAEFRRRLAALVADATAKQATLPDIPIVNAGHLIDYAFQQKKLDHIPEDSTLRRHFVTQLKAQIESELPEKPTDFNLLRHYKSMVDRLLEQEIAKHSV